MTDDPVTLITGGSSGIGAATARILLDHGHRVVITGRNKERLDAFAESLGRPDELIPIPGDASDPDAVDEAVSTTLDRFGRLDNAVANAGYITEGGASVTEGDPTGWRDMILTNVLGPALLIHAALPALTESRGRIVLVGSVAGIVHTPANLYGATKWAVTGLAENTRRAVSDQGVGVTLINPAATESNFWDALGGRPDRAMLPTDAVAEAITWAIGQPDGVDVNTITLRPPGAPV
jgi:NADP-dependent 3-hydroxy acid dehydrogenase YdfG